MKREGKYDFTMETLEKYSINTTVNINNGKSWIVYIIGMIS
jgi:hypothetical protein